MSRTASGITIPSANLPDSPARPGPVRAGEAKQWRAGGGFLPREIFTDVKRRSLVHWGFFSPSSPSASAEPRDAGRGESNGGQEGTEKAKTNPEDPVDPVKPRSNSAYERDIYLFSRDSQMRCPLLRIQDRKEEICESIELNMIHC